jgi:hypothetical protein
MMSKYIVVLEIESKNSDPENWNWDGVFDGEIEVITSKEVSNG